MRVQGTYERWIKKNSKHVAINKSVYKNTTKMIIFTLGTCIRVCSADLDQMYGRFFISIMFFPLAWLSFNNTKQSHVAARTIDQSNDRQDKITTHSRNLRVSSMFSQIKSSQRRKKKHATVSFIRSSRWWECHQSSQINCCLRSKIANSSKNIWCLFIFCFATESKPATWRVFLT